MPARRKDSTYSPDIYCAIIFGPWSCYGSTVEAFLGESGQQGLEFGDIHRHRGQCWLLARGSGVTLNSEAKKGSSRGDSLRSICSFPRTGGCCKVARPAFVLIGPRKRPSCSDNRNSEIRGCGVARGQSPGKRC